MVDNFCQSLTQKERRRPGPDASLSPSEVVTLAIFARWHRFASERDFYRYADALPAQRLSNPARSLAIQPIGAASAGAHRGHRFAPGDAFGRSEMSLRSLGQLRHA